MRRPVPSCSPRPGAQPSSRQPMFPTCGQLTPLLLLPCLWPGSPSFSTRLWSHRLVCGGGPLGPCKWKGMAPTGRCCGPFSGCTPQTSQRWSAGGSLRPWPSAFGSVTRSLALLPWRESWAIVAAGLRAPRGSYTPLTTVLCVPHPGPSLCWGHILYFLREGREGGRKSWWCCPCLDPALTLLGAEAKTGTPRPGLGWPALPPASRAAGLHPAPEGPRPL